MGTRGCIGRQISRQQTECFLKSKFLNDFPLVTGKKNLCITIKLAPIGGDMFVVKLAFNPFSISEKVFETISKK